MLFSMLVVLIEGLDGCFTRDPNLPHLKEEVDARDDVQSQTDDNLKFGSSKAVVTKQGNDTQDNSNDQSHLGQYTDTPANEEGLHGGLQNRRNGPTFRGIRGESVSDVGLGIFPRISHLPTSCVQYL